MNLKIKQISNGDPIKEYFNFPRGEMKISNVKNHSGIITGKRTNSHYDKNPLNERYLKPKAVMKTTEMIKN